jgi:hypothetical protein
LVTSQDMLQYATIKDDITNILSLNNVKKKNCVTYDSAANDCFEVHKEYGIKPVCPQRKGISTQVLT